MSVWTHVAAIFRIDDFRFGPRKDFEKIFGKTVTYESDFSVWDDYEKHPKQYLPAGSEGSLEMTVWEDPDIHSVAAYTVSVFGDLRDFSNVKSIKKWFDKCCSKVCIRQAVITIECEDGTVIMDRYKHEE